MSQGHPRFARMLQDLGLSQHKAAEELGCSQAFVHYIVTGKKPPTLAVAFAIEKMSERWSDGPLAVAEWDPSPDDIEVGTEPEAALAPTGTEPA